MKNMISLLICIFILSSCENIDLTTESSRSSTPSIAYGEWVEVPANAGGLGLSKFYIMKYEAKALGPNNVFDADGQSVDLNTHIPNSNSDNLPWTYINAHEASSECQNLGEGYDLISNQEWMAIARNVENQDLNWSGGSVGDGCLNRGNSADTVCGYDGADPEAGSSRDIRASHILSNGQRVFDMAGNVWEWTDWNKNQIGFQVGPTTCSQRGVEHRDVVCNELVSEDHMPSNSSFVRADGMGVFAGDPSAQGAALRGDFASLATRVSIFTLELRYAPTLSQSSVGFRCVYRP